MDPASVIGILGSVFSIGDVVGRSIVKLTELRATYRNAPLMATMLIGQLYVIQSALNQLSSTWDTQAVRRNPRYQQLAMQMGTALESFAPLMLSLQTSLNNMHANAESMSARDRLSFMWNEKEMSDFFTLVDRQVNALNLLLQAIQCTTWAEQQRIIDHDDSQSILQLARDCSSSMIGVLDGDSVVTETTGGISVDFEFDNLIMGSKPYLSAHRTNLRAAIRAVRPQMGSDGSNTMDAGNAWLDGDSTFAFTPSDAPARQSDASAQVTPIRQWQHSSISRVDSGTSTRQFQLQFIEAFAKSVTELKGPVIPSFVPTPKPYRPVHNQRPPSPRAVSLFRRIVRPSTAQQEMQEMRERAREIEELLRADRMSRRDETKILILGSSESGKSTLLKGLKLLMEGNYNLDSMDVFKEIVFSNIVSSCRVVLEAMEALEICLDDGQVEPHVQTIFMQPHQIEGSLTEDVVAAIKACWADGGFRKCYARRREYQLNDSFEYYVNAMDRIGAPHYLPSTEDMVRIRMKTTGITETTFEVHNLCLRVFDVGGTRSERKKWIHCFESVDMILFTVDIAAYDRLLFEDETCNRMQEQLTLFDSIVNSRWFPSVKFVLIFSKVNFLEQYLAESHPGRYFPDFSPGPEERSPTVREYTEYIEDRFVSLAVDDKRRNNIKVVYADLADLGTYGLEAHSLMMQILTSPVVPTPGSIVPSKRKGWI